MDHTEGLVRQVECCSGEGTTILGLLTLHTSDSIYNSNIKQVGYLFVELLVIGF
jgi:hypothetical protein